MQPNLKNTISKYEIMKSGVSVSPFFIVCTFQDFLFDFGAVSLK
jgi:hypothetical protein